METKKISDVANVFNGKTPSKKEQRENGHPVLKIKDIDEFGQFRGFESFVDDDFVKRHKKKALYLGDTLVLNAAHNSKYVGSKNTYVSDKKLQGVIATGEWTIIRPKEFIDSRYLNYYITSGQVRHLIGTVVKGIHLYPKDVLRLHIPLPPLDQQKKIAAILDEADKLRQLDKQLIEKYDALAQSLFLDMFGDPVTNPKGWESINLGSVCGVGSSKRVFVDELVEDGIPFYRGTEVGKLGEGKSIVPTLFITRDHYARLKAERGIPKQGDLLMPSICPDGRIWVVDNDKEFYFKDGRVLWVEVDSKKMNSIYLRYHLKGSFFANYNNIASGTTFAELKIVALKKMTVFYPDMKLQNQFAERVQAIEGQKALAQESLKKSEALFNSLLQKAFKGELVK